MERELGDKFGLNFDPFKFYAEWMIEERGDD